VYLSYCVFTNQAVQIRPNILINPEDERELFIIRNGAEMDKCEAYNLISESPCVEAEFNCEKKYCPKYTVNFYAETPWTNKFMSIVMQVIQLPLYSF
jgi:hypothetical protein